MATMGPTRPLPGQQALIPRPVPTWQELGYQLDRVEELRHEWERAKEEAKAFKAEHDEAVATLRNMRLRMRYMRPEPAPGGNGHER